MKESELINKMNKHLSNKNRQLEIKRINTTPKNEEPIDLTLDIVDNNELSTYNYGDICVDNSHNCNCKDNCVDNTYKCDCKDNCADNSHTNTKGNVKLLFLGDANFIALEDITEFSLCGNLLNMRLEPKHGNIYYELFNQTNKKFYKIRTYIVVDGKTNYLGDELTLVSYCLSSSTYSPLEISVSLFVNRHEER